MEQQLRHLTLHSTSRIEPGILFACFWHNSKSKEKLVSPWTQSWSQRFAHWQRNSMQTRVLRNRSIDSEQSCLEISFFQKINSLESIPQCSTNTMNSSSGTTSEEPTCRQTRERRILQN